MIKVSFDFDDTLDRPKVQDYAKSLINKGIEVHITTSRYEDVTKYKWDVNHDNLFKVAERLGIPKERIHFTNFVDKGDWFIMNPEYDFLWHLDDNIDEIRIINDQTSIRAIDSVVGMWKEKCNRLIEHANRPSEG